MDGTLTRAGACAYHAGMADTFAGRLRHARKLRMLTQRELAAAVGVHPRLVQKWEAGRVAPRPASQRRLCEVLEVSPTYLFGLDERIDL